MSVLIGNIIIGFFLQCNGESNSSLWSCDTYAELVLVSQKDRRNDLVKRIHHTFSPEENDWGFSHFVLWYDIVGSRMGFFKDNTLIFQARVDMDPSDAMRASFSAESPDES